MTPGDLHGDPRALIGEPDRGLTRTASRRQPFWERRTRVDDASHRELALCLTPRRRPPWPTPVGLIGGRGAAQGAPRPAAGAAAAAASRYSFRPPHPAPG